MLCFLGFEKVIDKKFWKKKKERKTRSYKLAQMGMARRKYCNLEYILFTIFRVLGVFYF
jgi:hypothetical protein